MKKYPRTRAFFQRQGGQALIAMMVFMALGAVLLVPMLNYIGTGLIGGKTFLNKADQYYAADAGVENGLWQIRNDNQDTVLIKNIAGVATPYDRYDYYDGANGTRWAYQLTGASQVNKYNVDIKVDNQWMPYGLSRPTPAQAQAVIEGQGGVLPKMIVSGEVSGFAKMPDGVTDDTSTPIYQVTLSYTPAAGDNLTISSIGIWLPSGFSYVANSVSLAAGSVPAQYRPTATNMYDYKGSAHGAIVWSFNSVAFKNLGGVLNPNASPIVCKFTLSVHATNPNRSLDAIAWINTNTDLGGGLGINYAWDGDTNVFHFNSTAVDPATSANLTQVDAYAIQSKMRDLNSAINGDYVVVGNSLMIDNTPGDNERDTLLSQSSSTVSTIPTDANIQLAYLYWSGWLTAATGGSPALPTGDPIGSDISGTWTPSVTGSTTDWLSPTQNAATTGGDGNGYEVNPTNAYADNPSNQSYASNINGAGDRHLYYGYNVSGVPAGSTILGIEVRLDWWLDSNSGTNSMSVELSWDGGMTWSAAEKDNNEPTNNTTSDILGGSADTWGHTWTTAQLSNLRVRLTCNSTSGSRDFYLDWVPIRITYATASGNLYSLVDEVTPANDSDYITGTTTNGGYCLFTFPNYNIPAGSNINSLTVHVRAETVSIGTAHITGDIKVGGVRYPYSTTSYDSPSNTTFTDYSYVWSFNPSTGDQWTVNDINGIGSDPIQAFGVYSNDLSPNVKISSIYAEVNWNAPPNKVNFTINGGTVIPLTANLADPAQVQSALRLDPLNGFYYGCRVDVTSYVKNQSNGANLSANPPVYGDGDGTYKVAPQVGLPLGTVGDSASFAGWSLVIVYSSPDTKGHQVYLYDLKDTFSSVPASNGSGGPTIQLTPVTGFLVPQQITGETDVAKLTIFVGEGDAGINGDYVALIDQHDATEHHLWDGVTLTGAYSGQNTAPNYSNVWNGYSTGSSGSQEGIDIDTFTIKWADNQLLTGDTAATIKLYTNGDGYVILYKIMSFRSSITAGGAITYLIK